MLIASVNGTAATMKLRRKLDFVMRGWCSCASQRLVERFAEQRCDVLGVVEANDLQLRDRRAGEYVERCRRLTERPDPLERETEHAADQHAIDRVVGSDQCGVIARELRAHALEHGPRALLDIAERLGTWTGGRAAAG